MQGEWLSYLDHLGPHKNTPRNARALELAGRVWTAYHEYEKQNGPVSLSSRIYLIRRMMYIAELASDAILLNATWNITPAAMSLLRDRYEQTVRFSYLLRNPDEAVYESYERTKVLAINTMLRETDPEIIKEYETSKGQRLPAWATEVPTKEQKAKLKEWSKLTLEAMAKKRDTFPPPSDTPLAKERLARWYSNIYRLFSSVSHYDRYCIDMIELQNHPDGGSYHLTFPDYWPGMLIFHTIYFDLIQCSEAVKVGLKQEPNMTFESLFTEWCELSGEFIDS